MQQMPHVPYYELYRQDKPEKRLPLRRGNVLRIITSIPVLPTEEKKIREQQGLDEPEEDETTWVNHIERAYPESRMKPTVCLGMNVGGLSGKTIDLENHLPMPEIHRGPPQIHLEFIHRKGKLFVINRTQARLELETDRQDRKSRWIQPGQAAPFKEYHRIRLEHHDNLGPTVHTIEWVPVNEHHDDTIENHMSDLINADYGRHPEWHDQSEEKIEKVEREKRKEAKLMYQAIPEAPLQSDRRVNPSN